MEWVEHLRWAASVSAIAAAFLVAARISDRLVLAAFVLFAFSSAAWVAAAVVDERQALLTQNLVLLGINAFGIVRWLRQDRNRNSGEKAG